MQTQDAGLKLRRCRSKCRCRRGKAQAIEDVVGRAETVPSRRLLMCYLLEFAGVGIDGVEGAEGIDKGGAGVHGHGNAEGFGDFLFGGAGFEGGVGVKGDAAVAAGGYGNGNGDELAGFFAEERGFGVGGGEGLIAFEGVWG